MLFPDSLFLSHVPVSCPLSPACHSHPRANSVPPQLSATPIQCHLNSVPSQTIQCLLKPVSPQRSPPQARRSRCCSATWLQHRLRRVPLASRRQHGTQRSAAGLISTQSPRQADPQLSFISSPTSRPAQLHLQLSITCQLGKKKRSPAMRHGLG